MVTLLSPACSPMEQVVQPVDWGLWARKVPPGRATRVPLPYAMHWSRSITDCLARPWESVQFPHKSRLSLVGIVQV
jgi:hypothetical protein